MNRSAALLTLVVIAAPGLFADTVYSTFGPGNSFVSNAAWKVGDVFDAQIAASFVPGRDFTLQAIDIEAFVSSGSGDLTVALSAGPSSPGTPLESFDLTGVASSPTFLTMDSALHPVLTAGTTYWIVLSASAGTVAGWNQNDQGFVGLSSRQGGGPWVSLGTELSTPAFDVLGAPAGAVPEPSGAILLASAFLAQAAALAYRRSRPHKR